MMVDHNNIVGISEANKRGLSKLVADAEGGRDLLLMRGSTPAAVLVSVERMNTLSRLEALEEDLGLLALALVRTVTDDGSRISLDDLLDEFGLTREELAHVDPDSDDED